MVPQRKFALAALYAILLDIFYSLAMGTEQEIRYMHISLIRPVGISRNLEIVENVEYVFVGSRYF